MCDLNIHLRTLLTAKVHVQWCIKRWSILWHFFESNICLTLLCQSGRCESQELFDISIHNKQRYGCEQKRLCSSNWEKGEGRDEWGWGASLFHTTQGRVLRERGRGKACEESVTSLFYTVEQVRKTSLTHLNHLKVLPSPQQLQAMLSWGVLSPSPHFSFFWKFSELSEVQFIPLKWKWSYQIDFILILDKRLNSLILQTCNTDLSLRKK